MSGLLTRAGAARSVRHVHLGLGAFHRAHQLAYTDHADTAGQWGVASFTGRKPDIARLLEAQGGVYTLVERGPGGDAHRVIQSLSQAHDGADVARLAALVADPQVAIISLTITEAGYCLAPDGTLDSSNAAIAGDRQGLATLADTADASYMQRLDEVRLSTVPARLVAALEARRRAHGSPITLVPCDNLPANGEMLANLVAALGQSMGQGFVDWMRGSVDVVSTSVDRITPATTEGDLADVERATGRRDRAVVVTEPFTDWVLSGDFRAGRPAWEQAGARFVDDIEPFENRKLWMLNGAHTLLANAGRLRGYATVAEAINDPALLEATNALWDEAASCLDNDLLQLDAYRAALLARFGNARIEHRLGQIATDTATKLAIRVVPVALARLAAGQSATASARAIAAWIAARNCLTPVVDSREDEVVAAAGDPQNLVRMLSPELAQHDDFTREVRDLAAELASTTATARSTP
jgi:fructuronate reductase